ncbi:MAG: hypothetical protein L6Q95_07065 [Planctomycetes bacterium]|nr:hypothetical protein [Planctomycetota bacterium]
MLGGCGGDGDTDFAAIQQALEECSASTMTSMVNAIIAIVSVPDVIAGESPTPGFDVNATLSVDPLDPPFTYDFSIVFDTNQNAVPDSAIVGKMTFSGDPTDGLDPLDTIQIDFTVQNSPLVAGAPVENGTVTGSGDLAVTLGALPEQASITGTISLTDTAGDGCNAALTFPVGTPLNLDFTDEALPALAANVGFEIFGTIQAFIESLGHELDATVTLLDGDQTVSVVGTIDDIDVDFDFELLPTDQVIGQLFDCLLGSGNFIFSLTEAYDQVLAAVLGGTPPAGVIVTPTANPNVFNYTIDLAAFAASTFTAGTITGQATLVFPVATSLAGAVPSEVTFTWTIAAATYTGGEVVSGQNAVGRPLRLRLDALGAVLAFSGAGSITITPPAAPLAGIIPPTECNATFDIPESDPVAADESDGLLILTVDVGGEDVMVAILDFSEEETILTINGISFPFLPL